MIGQSVILASPRQREIAKRLVDAAPHRAFLTIKPETRTSDQNRRFWAMLGDISRSKPEGRELTPEVWKSLFLHSLGHTQRFEMALDGRGVVPVGFRSSRLSKSEMSDLMEMMSEYGARHGVEWSEPVEQERAA